MLPLKNVFKKTLWGIVWSMDEPPGKNVHVLFNHWPPGTTNSCSWLPQETFWIEWRGEMGTWSRTIEKHTHNRNISDLVMNVMLEVGEGIRKRRN